jgi:hypothetical protein
VRLALLAAATAAGGLLVVLAARLNALRSRRTGWFLHCTAGSSRYQRQRFESEDRAYRQWALRRSPSPHVLPRLHVDVDRDGGTLRYLEAVERDLEVAFGMSPDVSQQVYLLVNGVHEANFWLGWHLASTFRRSRPLKAISFVSDQPAASGTDSHDVIARVPDESIVQLPHRVIGLDITRRRAPRLLEARENAGVRISLSCANAKWGACNCDKPHHNAIIAIDPEVDLAMLDSAFCEGSVTNSTGKEIAGVVRSPRMQKGIAAIAAETGADAVLWAVCDGIESSAHAYTVFLETVMRAIEEHTTPGGRRYLAFTGPVVLAVLLGVRLANRGQWCFLAYMPAHGYTEAPNPRALV